jgi:hypothetical protein
MKLLSGCDMMADLQRTGPMKKRMKDEWRRTDERIE